MSGQSNRRTLRSANNELADRVPQPKSFRRSAEICEPGAEDGGGGRPGPEDDASEDAEQCRRQRQRRQQGDAEAEGDGWAGVAHLGELRHRHQAEADHDRTGAGSERLADAADAFGQRVLDAKARFQLLAVSANQEQAVIGPRAIENHDREYLADIDQVNARDQRHDRQHLE